MLRAMRTCFAAGLLVPVAGPPQRDGAVLVEDGRVAAVGAASDLTQQADRSHRFEGVVMPATVEADAAVELHDALPDSDEGDVDEAAVQGRWGALAGRTTGWDGDRWARSARRGVQALLRGGVAITVDGVRRGDGVAASRRAGLAGDSLVVLENIERGELETVRAAAGAALRRRVTGRRIGLAVDATQPDGIIRPLVQEGGGAPLALTTAPGAPVRAGWLEKLGALRPGVVVGPDPNVSGADAARLAAEDVTVLLSPNGWPERDAPPLAPLASAGVPVRLGSGPVAQPDPLATAAAFAAEAARQGLTRWPTTEGQLTLGRAALRLVTVDGAAGLAQVRAGRLTEQGPAHLVALDLPPDDVDLDGLAAAGAGRQIATVLGGVRATRRRSAEVEWPPIDRQEWRDGQGG